MSSSSEDGAAAAAYAALYTHSCESDFLVIELKQGEAISTVVRVISTLITVSIISSWGHPTKIRRLLLFFSHWLSGLMHQLAEMAMATMVSVCWFKSNVVILIKALKFVELVSSNMLAVTNLAICVNLALIVSSHHTMSRVQSVSSPKLILCFLLISITATVAAVPFWDDIAVSQTLFWIVSTDQEKFAWVMTSIFFLEFAVGVVMLIIVTLLVVFRLPELKECWQLHRRIQSYFGLTVIAIFVNLALGVGGVLFVTWERRQVIISITWSMRYIHIALDTWVLYGVLGVSPRRMDERSGQETSTDDRSLTSDASTSKRRFARIGDGQDGTRKMQAARRTLSSAA